VCLSKKKGSERGRRECWERILTAGDQAQSLCSAKSGDGDIGKENWSGENDCGASPVARQDKVQKGQTTASCEEGRRVSKKHTSQA